MTIWMKRSAMSYPQLLRAIAKDDRATCSYHAEDLNNAAQFIDELMAVLQKRGIHVENRHCWCRPSVRSYEREDP